VTSTRPSSSVTSHASGSSTGGGSPFDNVASRDGTALSWVWVVGLLGVGYMLVV
jgi:hypothetical protein